MKKIAITIDALTSTVTIAELLNDLRDTIAQSTFKQLERPYQNWSTEIANITIWAEE